MAKRKVITATDQAGTPPGKRQKTGKTSPRSTDPPASLPVQLLRYPQTIKAYNLFKTQYNLSLDLRYFVGLCAYLYGILMHGYASETPNIDLDSFITQYTAYHRSLPALKETQYHQKIPAVPSYHAWIRDLETATDESTQPAEVAGGKPQGPSLPILNAKFLKAIGKENAYMFTRTFLTLEVLAVRWRNERESRRALDAWSQVGGAGRSSIGRVQLQF